MLKRDATNKILIPDHSTYEYVDKMLSQLGWSEADFLTKRIISQSELSKLKSGVRGGLTSKKFYRLYKGFNDSASHATSIIYPELDLSLNEFVPPSRNEFGQFMRAFENEQNSPEEISVRTGIELKRIKLIYFKTGSPEAYELLLIEKAVGVNMGELFEAYYGLKF